MVELTIEGDFDGADQARKSIEAIVSERTSSTSIKITSIPADFFDLLRINIAQIANSNDVKIKIPSPSFTEDIPVSVSVSGEKSLVAVVKDELERLYEELKISTIPTTFPVAKKQHQFVAAHISEITQASGCSVVVPPSSSSSDNITIRGPAANIGLAITLVMEKARSMAVESLEISRAHPSADNQVQHAVNLANFFRATAELHDIEKKHSVSISVPSEADLVNLSKVTVDISSKSEANVVEARKAVVALVNRYPPTKVRTIEIEPLLHKRIEGPKLKNSVIVKKQFNVDLLFPSPGAESSSVVLVYIGDASSSDETKQALESALDHLTTLVDEAGSISSETVSIPEKHHQSIKGKNNTTLNAITGGSDAVTRIVFGKPEPDSITVKGPKPDVTRVIREIQSLADQAENSDIANSYKAEFDFPAQFTKNLIGKGGVNISKIRDDLGVRIDVGDEGKIVCQGPQRNVEEARSRITILGERLADETTYKLKIPAEFHGQIIGQGGKFVKRLEEKYQVQINFPRSGQENVEGDEKVAKNEVTIKGGKKGASAARSEIMELFEYENEHSHTATIQVLQRAVAQIVGKSGATINELKDETNTRIDIERSEVGESPDSPVSIVITGKKSQVEAAKSAILEINKEVEDTVTRTLTIDPAFHRNLIGAGGANIREIVVKAGGPDDASLRARMVRFPRAGVDSSEVVLKGPKKIIDKIAKALEKVVGDTTSQHSEIIMVPKEQVRIVIGRGGNKKTELETRYSVTIDIPRAESVETAEAPIKVLGQPDAVASAAAEIAKLVKIPESETVQVPRKLHRQVADGAAFIRRLRSEHQVSVDHDGHELPKVVKTAPATASASLNSNARIDDDGAEPETAWSVVELGGSEESGDIPWVLKGDVAQIAKAKKALLSAVAKASEQTHIGYLSVPAAKHRFIIGQGGSKINAIRADSGTRIDVPKSQGDEVVVIRGSLAGLDKAKALILEATTAPTGNRREY